MRASSTLNNSEQFKPNGIRPFAYLGTAGDMSQLYSFGDERLRHSASNGTDIAVASLPTMMLLATTDAISASQNSFGFSVWTLNSLERNVLMIAASIVSVLDFSTSEIADLSMSNVDPGHLANP
jgi:hypothetical protein